MAAGYLIHIDGALTKEYDAVDPSVDKKLISRLESLLYEGGKIALITGRTEKWLDQHLIPLIDYDNFLILGEYGNFRAWQRQRSWDDKAQEFERRYRENLKGRITEIAKAHGIRARKDDRDYEPKSGELWFAPGVGVLSIRCLIYKDESPRLSIRYEGRRGPRVQNHKAGHKGIRRA